jgi:predicted transcriptional regulator
MSTLSLRLPDSLHKRLKELAKRDGISINQFIATAVAEKMAALDTEEYLEKRARRGSREKFQTVLSKVPDVPPDEADALPKSRRKR